MIGNTLGTTPLTKRVNFLKRMVAVSIMGKGISRTMKLLPEESELIQADPGFSKGLLHVIYLPLTLAMWTTPSVLLVCAVDINWD